MLLVLAEGFFSLSSASWYSFPLFHYNYSGPLRLITGNTELPPPLLLYICLMILILSSAKTFVNISCIPSFANRCFRYHEVFFKMKGPHPQEAQDIYT